KMHFSFLRDIINQLKNARIRTSIFLNPDESLIESAKDTGTDRIELYTESYATLFLKDKDSAIAPYIATAEKANKMGLGINAGHDLDLHNLRYFAQNIPLLEEVSIGHALICDALEYGMSNTVKMYLNQLG